MGANVSRSVQETIQKTKTSLKQDCTPSTEVQQKIEDIWVVMRGNAKCGDLRVQNRAVAVANCDMSATIQNLAEATSGLTTKQKAALGLNISSDIQKNKTIIENEINNKCGSKAKIQQQIKGQRFELWDNAQCDALSFVNEADAKSACVMKIVNDNVSKILQQNKKEQSGFNPLGIFGGVGMYVLIGILVLAVLAVIGGLVFFLMKSGGKSDSSGGESISDAGYESATQTGEGFGNLSLSSNLESQSSGDYSIMSNIANYLAQIGEAKIGSLQ